MSKLKVAISYLVYPLTMAGYFVRAFERRDDVELWTVGPYTGAYIPWMHGMFLPSRYVKAPNCPLPSSLANAHPPFASVRKDMPWTPDLFLMIDAGWHFVDRPDGDVVARIQTDPHVLKDFYKYNRALIDYEFCMQSPYMEEGEYYLPYGYDPTIFYPMDLEKEFDACLIGLQYPQRTAWVDRLRARNLKVHYSTGAIYDENREIYNKSKLALSWSTLIDLPARVWEGLAMKLPVVTNRVPDLNKFFKEGEHYAGFSTVEEAEKQCLLLLADDEKRDKMAEAGYNAVLPHTWDARVQTILETCGLV